MQKDRPLTKRCKARAKVEINVTVVAKEVTFQNFVTDVKKLTMLRSLKDQD